MEDSKNDVHNTIGYVDEKQSYFEPNYPVKQPVFYIPKVPNLIKVPEPKAPIRPPPPGYDMKTLRKQLEFLNNEINEKTETQSMLYTQNEQLWLYIQELLEANKANAQFMKVEVVKAQEELNNALEERQKITDQLNMAKNSKQMMADLYRELDAAKLAAEDAEQLRQQAEQELHRAKTEAESLEDTLQKEVENMTQLNQRYDDIKAQAREKSDLERADKFFATNKAVLKAAYSRFKTSIQKRLKLSSIHNIVYSIYSKFLKTHSLAQWKKYLHRRSVMHRNDRKRDFQLKTQVFIKWKVYSALESMFKQSRRKYLLSHYFAEWNKSTKETVYERNMAIVTTKFKERQFVKKHFLAWKKSVLFIFWKNKDILRLEASATVYFIRKLFAQWRAVTGIENNLLYQKTRVIPTIIMKNRFKLWHNECLLVWRLRGKLLNRFFVHLKRSVRTRKVINDNNKFADKIWVFYKKFAYLRRWSIVVKNKRKFRRYLHNRTPNDNGSNHIGSNSIRNLLLSGSGSGSSASNSVVGNTQSSKALTSNAVKRLNAINLKAYQLFKQHTSKLLRSSFYSFEYRTTVLRKQRLSLQIAKTKRLTAVTSNALHIWRVHTQYDRKKRIRQRTKLLTVTFKTWVSFVTKQKKEALHKQQVLAFTANVEATRHSTLLYRWFDFTHKRARHRRIVSYLRQKRYLKAARKTFIRWSNQYSNKLYWRFRELEVENSHVLAIKELKLLEVSDLQIQQEKSALEAQQMETYIREMEDRLATQDAELARKRELLAEREREKSALISGLEEMQVKLRDAEADAERLRGFEEMMQASLAKEQEERAARQQQVDLMLVKQQTESQQLRVEVQVAREQLVLQEQVAEKEFSRGRAHLEELEKETGDLEHELREKRGLNDQLEREHKLLLKDLERVQVKLEEINEGSDELIAENEAHLRRKQSELRVVQSNAGLAEARVAALYEMIEEKRVQEGEKHLKAVQMEENRELNELLAIQQQIREHHGLSAHLTGSSAPLMLLTDHHDHHTTGNPSYQSKGRRSGGGGGGSKSNSFSSSANTPVQNYDVMHRLSATAPSLSTAVSTATLPLHHSGSHSSSLSHTSPNLSRALHPGSLTHAVLSPTADNLSESGGSSVVTDPDEAEGIFKLTSPHKLKNAAPGGRSKLGASHATGSRTVAPAPASGSKKLSPKPAVTPKEVASSAGKTKSTTTTPSSATTPAHSSSRGTAGSGTAVHSASPPHNGTNHEKMSIFDLLSNSPPAQPHNVAAHHVSPPAGAAGRYATHSFDSSDGIDLDFRRHSMSNTTSPTTATERKELFRDSLGRSESGLLGGLRAPISPQAIGGSLGGATETYLEAKRNASSLLENVLKEEQYRDTKQAMRALTERLSQSTDKHMNL